MDTFTKPGGVVLGPYRLFLVSHQPPSTLSFNVPVRPEGLAGADSFRIYSGDVRTASDLTQPVPIECTVTAGRAPVPGEQLTVADPLPDPGAGDARYWPQ